MYTLENAIDAGLMDEVVESDNLMKVALEKATDLATMGHPAYSMTKELYIAKTQKKIDDTINELDS